MIDLEWTSSYQSQSYYSEGTCWNSDNFQQALTYFEASILQNDDNAWAWHGKGDAHQWLGDYKESLNAYEQASTRSPTEGLHWGGRANALYGLKEYAAAHDLRQRTLTLDPTLHWMFSKWDQTQHI